MDKKKIILIPIILLTTITIIMFGNNTTTKENTTPRFKIYITNESNIDGLSYNYNDPKWKAFLYDTDLQNIFISDFDIEEYDWNNQEIVLNKDASKKIKEQYKKSMFNYEEKQFIVTLDENRIYAGSFLFIGSARAINYPVIYIDNSSPKVILSIRPLHSVLQDSYQKFESTSKQIIETEEIKVFFSEIGKLQEK